MGIPHEPCEACGQREVSIGLCAECFDMRLDEEFNELQHESDVLRRQLVKQQAEMAELRKQIVKQQAEAETHR